MSVVIGFLVFFVAVLSVSFENQKNDCSEDFKKDLYAEKPISKKDTVRCNKGFNKWEE